MVTTAERGSGDLAEASVASARARHKRWPAGEAVWAHSDRPRAYAHARTAPHLIPNADAIAMGDAVGILNSQLSMANRPIRSELATRSPVCGFAPSRGMAITSRVGRWS